MNKSGLIAASVAAASAISISSSSSSINTSSYPCNPCVQDSSQDGVSHRDHENSSSKEKFAPRFDGLRFIETLVTAHR